MVKPLFDTCPVCHSKDSIRKVSSIVSSEKLHGYMAGPTIGTNDYFGITLSSGSFSTELVSMLMPPQRPSTGIFESSEDKSKKLRLWEYQISIWNNLYYCYRDDVIFELGSLSAQPVYNTGEYLQWLAENKIKMEKASDYNEIFYGLDYEEDDPFLIDLIQKKIPHLIYLFTSYDGLKRSFLEIPGITFDEKSKKYYSKNKINILEEAYGVYTRAGIFGKKLKTDLIDIARPIFESNGGCLISEYQPLKPNFEGLVDNNNRITKVELIDKEEKYYVYYAPDSAIARYFLLNKKLPLWINRIYVETPEGNYYSSHFTIPHIQPFNVQCICRESPINTQRILKGKLDNIDALLNRAKKYENAGQNELAIQDYSRILEINPNNSDVLTRRGYLYQRMGKNEEAIKDLMSFLKLSPGNIPAIQSLAILNFENKNYENSIDNFTELINRNWYKTLYLENRARAFYYLNKFEEAINDFSVVIEKEPNNIDSLIYRAISNNKLGNYEFAIDDINRILEIEPNNIYALIQRAYANEKLGQFEAAINDCSVVIDKEPNNIKAFIYRAISNNKLGNYKFTIDDINRVLEIEPNNTYALLQRAYAYEMLGQFEAAINDSNFVLKIEPGNEYANKMNKRLLDKLVQLDNSSLDSTSTYKLDQSDITSILQTIVSNYRQGRYKIVILDTSRILEIDSNNINALTIRANAYEKMGEFEQALHDIDLLLEIDPDNILAKDMHSRLIDRLKP